MKFKYVLDRNVEVDERSPEWFSFTCDGSFIERSTFMSQNIDYFILELAGHDSFHKNGKGGTQTRPTTVGTT